MLKKNNKINTNKIMFLVIIAMLPGIITQYYFFGYGILIQIILAGMTAYITEIIVFILRKKYSLYFKDYSAFITSCILAMIIPALSPWWLIILGTIFSITIAKQCYGGLGQNIFNPAMVGYVFLLISFPKYITDNLFYYGYHLNKVSLINTINSIFSNYEIPKLAYFSNKILLNSLKNNLKIDFIINNYLIQPLVSNHLLINKYWQFINISYIIGGLFILFKNIINCYIPLTILLSLIISSTLGYYFIPQICISAKTHLFFSYTMLVIFFISTDPVTSPVNIAGSVLYSIIIGLLTWIIRSFSNYCDGISFSILLANSCVPVINYYTNKKIKLNK